ncbi:XRE family transcriptional regulator [uncultured Jannaschia sp.]|uniref:helix-turn-helix domain-containing protein n=1 Tax=uncultured Jannaschia sp. TaxID=293347 RepID=UPI002631F513|nr:XRE family transcriptional regulator [uncultured Jannaschia sp.]
MLGQRLKLARKKAGLSLRDLAERMEPHVSAQAISKYEADKMLPSSSVLVGLGRSLDVSLDFLMGGQVEELCGIEFRKHSRTGAKDRARAEAIVLEHLEDYLAVEDILDAPPQANAFGDEVGLRVESFEQIDHAARKLRRSWKLGIDPIPSLSALLEEKGIRLVQADLPERFDGLTCTVRCAGERSSFPVVVVSSRASVERRRFTLAHELAHRIIASSDNPNISLEKAMNRFAGAFLAPEEHLCSEFGGGRHGTTYREILRVKHVYGMSAAAMLVRLGQTGLLPEGVVQYAFRTWARRWRTEEPEPLREGEGFDAFERPRRYKSLVWRAVGEEMISPVRAAQLLKKPLADVEAQIRGPEAR